MNKLLLFIKVNEDWEPLRSSNPSVNYVMAAIAVSDGAQCVSFPQIARLF